MIKKHVKKNGKIKKTDEEYKNIKIFWMKEYAKIYLKNRVFRYILNYTNSINQSINPNTWSQKVWRYSIISYICVLHLVRFKMVEKGRFATVIQAYH